VCLWPAPGDGGDDERGDGGEDGGRAAGRRSSQGRHGGWSGGKWEVRVGVSGVGRASTRIQTLDGLLIGG